MVLKKLSKKKIVTLIVSVAAGFLVLFTIYYITVPAMVFSADKVAVGLGETVKERLGLQLRYKEAKFELFPRPAVKLTQPIMVSYDGKIVFKAESVKLGNSILAYIFLTSKLATINVYDGELDLASGDIRPAETVKTEKINTAIYLHHCNARILSGERGLTLEDLNGKLRLKSKWGEEHKVRGKVSASRLAFSAERNYDGPAVKLAAEGEIVYSESETGGLLVFEDMGLIFGDSKLNIKGSTQTGAGPNDIDIVCTGDNMALSQVVPALLPRLAEMDFDGTMDLDMSIKGKWGQNEKPDIDGELVITDGKVDIADADGISSMQGKIIFIGKKVNIENISGVTPQGDFNVKGNADLDGRAPFEVFLTGVYPLELVAGIVGADPNYQIGGMARLEMDCAGELSDRSGTAINGSAELINSSIRLKPFVASFNSLEGTLYFDGFKITSKKIRGKLGNSNFEMGGNVIGFKNPKIEFTAISDDMDFDAALPKNKETLEKLKKRGDAPIGISKDGLRLSGTVNFAKCRIFGVDSTDFRSGFDFADNAVNFSLIEFNAYDGTVRGTGKVRLTQPPAYSFTTRLENVRAGIFLSENDYVKDGLTGKLNGDVSFTGQSLDKATFNRTLNGRGLLSHSSGRATNIKVLEKCVEWSKISYFDPLQITTMETLIAAENGVLSSERMYIKNSEMEIDVAGTIYLDEENLNLTVTVLFSPEATAEIERNGDALTLISEEGGRGRLNFKITGTVDKPSFNLDADKAFFMDRPGDEVEGDIVDPDIDPEDLDIFR